MLKKKKTIIISMVFLINFLFLKNLLNLNQLTVLFNAFPALNLGTFFAEI